MPFHLGDTTRFGRTGPKGRPAVAENGISLAVIPGATLRVALERGREVYGRHMFSDEQLNEPDLALRPCRVEAHGGDQLVAEWWCANVLPANWKIAMEAFMEGCHVMKTHPQLHGRAPAAQQQS